MSLASSAQDQSQGQKQFSGERDDPSCESQSERSKPDESSSDISKGRPMSPSTLALMCDEQDTMFTSVASSNGLVAHNASPQLPYEQGPTEAYVEQERVVLTKFRECLNRLITLGELKETKYSLLARTQSVAEKELTSSSIGNVKTEPRNQQTISNGVTKNAAPSPMVTLAAHATSNQRITTAENGDVISKRPEGEL